MRTSRPILRAALALGLLVAVPAAANPGYQVTFQVTSDWGSGFGANVTIVNTGSAPLTNWQLAFDLDRQIDSIWNAQVLSRTGSRYVLKAMSYNATIPAGGSVSLGFNGSPGNLASVPTVFTLTSGGGGSSSPTPTATPLTAATATPTPIVVPPTATPTRTPTPRPTATATIPPTAVPTSGGTVTNGVQVTYTTKDNWGSGFVGEVALRNTTAQTVQNWTLEFDFAPTITNIWNARQVSRTGNRYRFAPESYNASIAPGATVTFGFQGTPGNPAPPTAVVVTVGGTTAPPATPTAAAPTPSPTATATARPSATPTPPAGTPTPTPTAGPIAAGWLATRGSQIVDANGNVVRLTGVNWFGLETRDYAPHGLWSRNMGSMLDQIKSLGYNCLRVPFSNELLTATGTPNVNLSANPDLAGLNGLQILDKLIAGCQQRGLKVILDRHRPDAGGQSELWYTAQYSEQRWISDWVFLVNRYKGSATVIGCDLHNEPHGSATWGSGNLATDWRLAAERCGNAILAANPNLLIVVEGIERHDGRNYWWGGNLRGARDFPVRLNVPNRLVYSPHDYPQTVYDQTWFSDPSYPANLAPLWDETWGYLVKQNIAPVLLSEFGTKYETVKDQQWLQTMAAYIAANNLSFTFWSWNPNSGDTGGILRDDWNTIRQDKQAVLQPLLAPMVP